MTVYYLFGSKAALDAISGRLAHRAGSRAIAILGDDEPGLEKRLIVREHPGSTPDLGWLVGPLVALQREHERGQPWAPRAQKRAIKAWRQGRARLKAAEVELEEARGAMAGLARAVIVAHGNRAIIDGETKLTPCFVACNDTVYLVESALPDDD
jgi:hypothetical protein